MKRPSVCNGLLLTCFDFLHPPSTMRASSSVPGAALSGVFLSLASVTYGQLYGNATIAGNATTVASIPPPSGFSFANPTGVSTTYATKSYNESLASTQLPQTDFSNERLAFLWDQVGPVATGPVTTTVSPTPEPSKYASPGVFHPYIPSYEPGLANAKLPPNFVWGVASSAYQIEVGAAKTRVRRARADVFHRVLQMLKERAHRSGTFSPTVFRTRLPTTPLQMLLPSTTTCTSRTSPG